EFEDTAKERADIYVATTADDNYTEEVGGVKWIKLDDDKDGVWQITDPANQKIVVKKKITLDRSVYPDEKYRKDVYYVYDLTGVKLENVIKFDKNDDAASGTMSMMRNVNPETDKLRAAGFSKKGYDFAGWSLAPDGEVEFADGADIADIVAVHPDAFANGILTLYARYRGIIPHAEDIKGIIAAPLVDCAGEITGDLATNYGIKGRIVTENDQISVSVKADNLLRHKADTADDIAMGYWAGIGIPVLSGDAYTVSYYQPAGSDWYGPVENLEAVVWKSALDSEIEIEGQKYATVYFDMAKISDDLNDGCGYVYVKFTSNTHPDEHRIITIKVDFSNVKLAMDDYSVVTDLFAADLTEEHPGEDPIPYEPDDYEVKTSPLTGNIKNYGRYDIPVEVKANNLKLQNGPKGVGYWIGIAIPQSLRDAAKHSNVYYYKGNSDPDILDINKPFNSVRDSEQHKENDLSQPLYDTFFFDAKDIAGTGKKRYVALRIVDSPVDGETYTYGLAETTIVYELDFSGVTLEEPEYEISIEDTS
ncbi:MAG: InlB B-repeat-containing protein, partial [Lachnospiraceae bacterium]|nr:InlB B-repeat-containing protein [Lachnospiraceae bacterium]